MPHHLTYLIATYLVIAELVVLTPYCLFMVCFPRFVPGHWRVAIQSLSVFDQDINQSPVDLAD